MTEISAAHTSFPGAGARRGEREPHVILIEPPLRERNAV